MYFQIRFVLSTLNSKGPTGYISYKPTPGLGNTCIYDYDNGIKCKANMRLLIIILYFLYITEILKVTLHDKTYINCKHYVFYPCEN